MRKICCLLLATLLLIPGTAFAASPRICSPWAEMYLSTAEYSARILPDCLKNCDYREDITRAEFCALAYETTAEIRGDIFYYEAEDKAKTEGDESYQAFLQEYGNDPSRLYPDLPSKNPFRDTDAPAILALYAAGIVEGKSRHVFAPEDTLTRQEAAAILGRMAEYLSLQTFSFENTFADADEIADWATEGVEIVCGMGVMVGMSDTIFSPTGPYTREQAVATMVRMDSSDPFLGNHKAVTEDLTCIFNSFWMWVEDQDRNVVFQLPKCLATYDYRNYGYDSWEFLPQEDTVLVIAHARDAKDPNHDQTTLFDLYTGEALATFPAESGYFYALSTDREHLIMRLTVSNQDTSGGDTSYYSVYGFDGTKYLDSTERWLDLYEAGYVDAESSIYYTWR